MSANFTDLSSLRPLSPNEIRVTINTNSKTVAETDRTKTAKYLFISNNLDPEYYSKVKSYIKKSNVVNKIIFIESVEIVHLSNLYNNAELYIFSSYCEVFGLTNIEAMACGVPVLTSKESAMPEVCGDAALYFDPFDSKDIAKNIKLLLNNKLLKSKMVKAGFIQSRKYTWEKTSNETKKIIFKVL